jgi:hypothetical protein
MRRSHRSDTARTPDGSPLSPALSHRAARLCCIPRARRSAVRSYTAFIDHLGIPSLDMAFWPDAAYGVCACAGVSTLARLTHAG